MATLNAELTVPSGGTIPSGPDGLPLDDPEAAIGSAMNWFALSGGAANVVMQLSVVPVGRGVAESRVDSGSLYKRPLKRARTTFGYVALAWHGTAEERAWLREEVDKQHRQVRSLPSDEVKYNAFDRNLQLWVAACMWVGSLDIIKIFYGSLGPRTMDALYERAGRFATTLQVPEDMWPADRHAFDEYWQDALKDVRMDDVTRAYLQDFAGLGFLPKPFQWLFGGVNRFFVQGFLPPEFRAELGLPWTEKDQARFERVCRFAIRLNKIMPPVLRAFPWNLMLWDARRRFRKGRPFV